METVYQRILEHYCLEVLKIDGLYTALLTNLTSGATLRNDGLAQLPDCARIRPTHVQQQVNLKEARPDEALDTKI